MGALKNYTSDQISKILRHKHKPDASDKI